MCNLYRMTTSNSEVAQLFGAKVGEVGNAGGGEVYGQEWSGLVLRNLVPLSSISFLRL